MEERILQHCLWSDNSATLNTKETAHICWAWFFSSVEDTYYAYILDLKQNSPIEEDNRIFCVYLNVLNIIFLHSTHTLCSIHHR